MRCEGASHRGLVRQFCSSSERTGPASTTVPSTVRNRPSESRARSGSGAGCGCISAHHAPSSSHSASQRKPGNARSAQRRQSAQNGCPSPAPSACNRAAATASAPSRCPRQTAMPHEIAAPHAGQRRLGCRECARCRPHRLPYAKCKKECCDQPNRKRVLKHAGGAGGAVSHAG